MRKISVFFLLPGFLLLACGETKEPTNNATPKDMDSVPAMETSDNNSGEDPSYEGPKVFYWDYDEQRGTEEAIMFSKEDALAEMKKLPETDGNFFGLELSDGKIVQFMYDGGKKTWFLDIPNPVTQESYNADLTIDDVLKIISDVYDGKSADDIKAAYK
jgi:hypothetical protein